MELSVRENLAIWWTHREALLSLVKRESQSCRSLMRFWMHTHLCDTIPTYNIRSYCSWCWWEIINVSPQPVLFSTGHPLHYLRCAGLRILVYHLSTIHLPYLPPLRWMLTKHQVKNDGCWWIMFWATDWPNPGCADVVLTTDGVFLCNFMNMNMEKRCRVCNM